MRQRSLSGWTAISIPHNWNGADTVFNRSSVGWYRKEFRLPRQPRGTAWVARFEGASHFATVYLNGREVGRHAGGYLPFEVDLRGLRKGRNRLVVRLSTLRPKTDLTHWRPARFNGFGTGGWWNFGGLSREVTVRPVGTIDVVRAQALPRLRCARCAARVQVRALVRNRAKTGRNVGLTLRVGRTRVKLVARRVLGRSEREIVGSFVILRPRLWRLRKGGLYSLRVTAIARKARDATYDTSFGVRALRRRADGTVLLNGRRLAARGVSVHEDAPLLGAAWRPAQRRETLNRVRELGATIVRSHYPLHPAMLEAFDRAGILVWDGAPVYQVQNDRLDLASVRRRAVAVNEETVLRDRGHPSVIAYAIANELPDPIGPGHAAFIRSAARRVRKLDPTRLVALDRVARLAAPDDANPVLNELDAIGVNEYYGWYRGAFPPLPPAVTADLGPYLDTLHRLHPKVALFVTEFGAEAARAGPADVKGTEAFQARLLRDHLAIIDTKRYVSGGVVWVLRDFRVHPTWSGGNPIPDPPYNHKGLLRVDGSPKPSFYEVQRSFRR
jgi:beta-glucuronidase